MHDGLKSVRLEGGWGGGGGGMNVRNAEGILNESKDLTNKF